MLENLPVALSSLQTALSLGRAMVDVRDSAKAQDQLIKFNEAIISAQQNLIEAQQEHQKLIDELRRAREECEELRRWDEEREKYVLRGIAQGVFAYMPTAYSGELVYAQKLCTNCFDQYRKSTLQQFRVEKGRQLGLRCPNGCPDLVFYDYEDVK